jgi:allophanate hydrolase
MALSLDFASLGAAYSSGALRPLQAVAEVYRRIAARGQDHVWTHVVPQSEAMRRAAELEMRGSEGLPLYGLPFCVKDNIHVAGLPTTAGCPGFSHTPATTATCAARAIEAGAILIGKNNMDQFATGLVGIRSPAGYCRNPFDECYIPGGSSSGSAVAVATGLASFSLGSDTGGSGRVPAALNNIVGLKPSLGAVSAAGLLYCNRSFDCVPIFALTCDDAWEVFRAIRGLDPSDPFSREFHWEESVAGGPFSFGAPDGADLEFFGDAAAERQFNTALDCLRSVGGCDAPFDYSAMREASQAVFGGAMLAERLVDYGEFVAARRACVHPVVAAIIDSARQYTAEQAFRELHRLQALKRQAHDALQAIDVLVVPTAGTIYECERVEADPVRLNANMGRYTYFVNPLDLCALAVPAGFRADGLPFGICLIGAAGEDAKLWQIGRRFHAAQGSTLGATGEPYAGRQAALRAA